MLYVNEKFATAGRGEEGGVPAGSVTKAAKRRFCWRRSSEHRTSRSCQQCQKKGVVLSPADDQQSRMKRSRLSWNAAETARSNASTLKMPTRLRGVIEMKKRKAVDVYFQSVRNKNGMMSWGSESSPLLPRIKTVLRRGKHVKALLDEKCTRAQNKEGLPLLPQEQSCACGDGW